jgi:hypothetical protein
MNKLPATRREMVPDTSFLMQHAALDDSDLQRHRTD